MDTMLQIARKLHYVRSYLKLLHVCFNWRFQSLSDANSILLTPIKIVRRKFNLQAFCQFRNYFKASNPIKQRNRLKGSCCFAMKFLGCLLSSRPTCSVEVMQCCQRIFSDPSLTENCVRTMNYEVFTKIRRILNYIYIFLYS